MSSALSAPAPHRSVEDPLAYLPRSITFEFRKGQVIYHQDQPSSSIFLIESGKVIVSRSTGIQKVVLGIYLPEEFFGESAVLGLTNHFESALALENTKLMTWTAFEIEEISLKKPGLAIAMMQLAAQRSADFTQRIESFSVDNIARRLARTLVGFAGRFGLRQSDGSTEMIPFTHELLSRYVGTSREIITQHMNQFRRQGYLQYSRRGLSLHLDAFQEWLRQPGEAQAYLA